MINLTGDLKQNLIVTQQRAELYMRIFKYAAEDFVNHDDMNTFVTALLTWAQSVEDRAVAQSNALIQHTHQITPHVHAIPPHTHAVPPHIHIAPTYGGPTTPAAMSTSPGGPGQSNLNEPLETQTPTNSAALRWQSGTIPNKYVNTTGVKTNVGGTKVVVGASVIGDTQAHQRRTLIAPEAATPNIPPYLTPTIV